MTESNSWSRSDLTSKTQIIILTEPWIGQKGTAHLPDWACILPANVEEARVSLCCTVLPEICPTPLTHKTLVSTDEKGCHITVSQLNNISPCYPSLSMFYSSFWIISIKQAS